MFNWISEDLVDEMIKIKGEKKEYKKKYGDFALHYALRDGNRDVAYALFNKMEFEDEIFKLKLDDKSLIRLADELPEDTEDDRNYKWQMMREMLTMGCEICDLPRETLFQKALWEDYEITAEENKCMPIMV